MNTWAKEQLEEMFGDDIVEQLAFLAGCTKHSYSDPKNPKLDGFIISQATLEKFAELIVRECINRIEQNRSSGENTDSWTITRDMAFHQMKTDLAEHFGVEQ